MRQLLKTLGLGVRGARSGAAMAFVAINVFTILFGGGLGDRFLIAPSEPHPARDLRLRLRLSGAALAAPSVNSAN